MKVEIVSINFSGNGVAKYIDNEKEKSRCESALKTKLEEKRG